MTMEKVEDLFKELITDKVEREIMILIIHEESNEKIITQLLEQKG